MTKNKNKSSQSEKRAAEIFEQPSTYSSADLGVSTALLCAGFELLSVEKTNPRKALFKFRKVAGIEEVVNLYLTDRLDVKARSFFDQLKALKVELYA